jgi:hypothetical protein
VLCCYSTPGPCGAIETVRCCAVAIRSERADVKQLMQFSWRYGLLVALLLQIHCRLLPYAVHDKHTTVASQVSKLCLCY